MFAATLLPPAGLAQTRAPDSIPNFSFAARLWRASDLKPAVCGRNPVKEFIEPKAKSAGRFSKKEFFVLSAAVSVRVWLTCVKRLKRGRIPGGMKPTPWQDRLRGYLHPPITRPDWRWLSTCIGLAAEWGTPGDGPSCRQSHKCWRLPETPTGPGPLLIGDNVEECRNRTCEAQSASLPGISRIRFFLTSSLSSCSYGATTSFSLDFT